MFFSISQTVAQDSSNHGYFFIGLEGRTAFPVGDFHNLISFGGGGSVWLGYRINSEVSLFSKVAILDFSNTTDTVTNFGSTSVETRTNVLIPMVLGMNYYFPGNELRPYGGLETGMFLFTDNLFSDISKSILSSSTAPDSGVAHFGISPTVGLQYNASPASISMGG